MRLVESGQWLPKQQGLAHPKQDPSKHPCRPGPPRTPAKAPVWGRQLHKRRGSSGQSSTKHQQTPSIAQALREAARGPGRGRRARWMCQRWQRSSPVSSLGTTLAALGQSSHGVLADQRLSRPSKHLGDHPSCPGPARKPASAPGRGRPERWRRWRPRGQGRRAQARGPWPRSCGRGGSPTRPRSSA